MTKVDYGERALRFNEENGVFGYMSVSGPLGGNYHPDRCVCQGNPMPGDRDPDQLRRGMCGPGGDTTPHKHRREPPYSCARCIECSAYLPWDEAAKVAAELERDRLRADARRIVLEAMGVAA